MGMLLVLLVLFVLFVIVLFLWPPSPNLLFAFLTGLLRLSVRTLGGIYFYFVFSRTYYLIMGLLRAMSEGFPGDRHFKDYV